MNMFKGSIPALITPMTKNRDVDYKAFAELVEMHIECATHAIVPMGTTGESPTLTHEEHKKIIALAVEVSAGRIPIMAGTGSNSTREAIALTQYAKQAGVDSVLVVVPYYNKPRQEGMYQHYKKIALESNIPLFIYNIPGRSVVQMNVETIKRLNTEMPNIFVGIKDATGNPDFTKDILTTVTNDFISLCGDDGLYEQFANNGAVGCISVTSNVAPKLCADMHNAYLNGDIAKFKAINDRLQPLHEALFTEPNPCPAKYAMMRLGLINSDEVRLPMVRLEQSTMDKVDDALKIAGLL